MEKDRKEVVGKKKVGEELGFSWHPETRERMKSLCPRKDGRSRLDGKYTSGFSGNGEETIAMTERYLTHLSTILFGDQSLIITEMQTEFHSGSHRSQ